MRRFLVFFRTIFPALMLSFTGVCNAAAAGKAEKPAHQHWHFSGPLGTFDKGALQRGFQVYETVCSSCHGLELLSFRNLGQKGGPFYFDRCPAGIPDTIDCSNPNFNPVVKAIAADYRYKVVDGPDDYGEMFERAPVPSDRFPGPFPNEQVARMANNNAYPVDLSLITKARHHGPDYIYSLLTGYKDPPAGTILSPGQYYNPYFSGGLISMAPPLADGIIEYTDGTPETREQYARDVTEFLVWAAEPHMEERKRMGMVTMAYLLILAVILYLSTRKIWSGVQKGN